MFNLPGIEDAMTRLNELTKERNTLRHTIWKRIIPFACRREFLKDPDAPRWKEDDLRAEKRCSIDWRILTDIDAPGPSIFVEIMITPRGGFMEEEESIEVLIPRERFFASEEENETYWNNVHRADRLAEALELVKAERLAEERRAKRKRTVEWRELKLLTELKAKYEVDAK